MNEKSYPRIGETVLEKTLPNGLKIFIVPKPQHRKKYAFFATRYGGMDMQFIRNGEKCDTPAGIAHYLEHKMFDTKDGNALQVLSQNGAEPNAFTSNAMTGYYFDCTEHFEENLRILLSFVSVPYFTDESVEKERGIIGQEIRMVEDSPDWQVYERLLACLYRSSPARVPNAGNAVRLPPRVLLSVQYGAVRCWQRRSPCGDRAGRGGLAPRTRRGDRALLWRGRGRRGCAA